MESLNDSDVIIRCATHLLSHDVSLFFFSEPDIRLMVDLALTVSDCE